MTTNANDVDGEPLLRAIPKDKSSLKAFIIEVFNKVHKSHKKPFRPIPKSPRSAP